MHSKAPRKSRKNKNGNLNRKISIAYAMLISSTIITPVTYAATSTISSMVETTSASTSSAIATSSVATSSEATSIANIASAIPYIKQSVQVQIPSPAELYATRLLNEGVINQVEAQLIIERNFSPENPWINYTEEDVIYLGDLMDAEECILLSKTNQGKRALYLAGSVVCNRIGKPELGGKTNVLGVINSVVSGHQQYASRTRRLIGKRSCLSHGHAFVYDWARDILTYGPIGSYRLVWQGPKQGRVYDKIGGEYFGEY